MSFVVPSVLFVVYSELMKKYLPPGESKTILFCERSQLKSPYNASRIKSFQYVSRHTRDCLIHSLW